MDAINGKTNGATPASGKSIEEQVANIQVTKADIAAARARFKQERRENLANWSPSESEAFRLVEIKLNSKAATRVFHLGLVHAQVSLFKFYEALPDQLEAVRTAEATINKKFDVLEKKLEAQLKQVKAVASAVMADNMDFTKAQSFSVRMFTPEAMRFGAMLKTYDEICETCTALFWAGKMTRTHKKNIVTEFRNELLRFARDVHVLFLQAKRSVVTLRNQRERARILKDKRKALTSKLERDLAIAAQNEAKAAIESPAAPAAPQPEKKPRARKANGAAAPAEATA